MGNVYSSYFDAKDEDPSGTNDIRPSESDAKSYTTTSQNQDLASAKLDFKETVPREISEEHKQKLNDFKLELDRKHEKRRNIIAEKRKEMEDLREEIEKLRQENAELKSSNPEMNQIAILRKENEELRALLNEKSSIIEESEVIVEKNHELRISIADMQTDLQRLNTEVLSFENERDDYRKHVVALKDVIAVSKNMLQIREAQLKELKEKVDCIEQSLADREVKVLSEDLRKEYERRITDLRNLRDLYEERNTAERLAREEITGKLKKAEEDLEQQNKKNSELEERITELELDNSKKYDEIKSLESNLGLSRAENRQCQEELSVINQLFSETLLRYNTSQELDLDKLQKHLEDHHGLLKDIVDNEISSEVSYALPKVLLELINQLYAAEDVSKDEPVEDGQDNGATNTRHQMSSPEEIVENLPKVWKVLIELLSHRMPENVLTDDETTNENPCYKKVETAKGPSLVLSVSQTFIRLKNLILEKKSLEKETAHLKHLNGHLENRLQDQEKRLGLVQNELSKTWLVVGKLQKQHQLLHTQEKILRYELAQKRKLLNELKEELEDSREKWTQAREKNSNTEEEWKKLRTEFANRRNATTLDDLNNSAESGYSDDRECSSDEEPGYETDVSECGKKNSGGKKKRHVEIEANEDGVDHSPEIGGTLQNYGSESLSGIVEIEDTNGGGMDDSPEIEGTILNTRSEFPIEREQTEDANGSGMNNSSGIEETIRNTELESPTGTVQTEDASEGGIDDSSKIEGMIRNTRLESPTEGTSEGGIDNTSEIEETIQNTELESPTGIVANTTQEFSSIRDQEESKILPDVLEMESSTPGIPGTIDLLPLSESPGGEAEDRDQAGATYIDEQISPTQASSEDILPETSRLRIPNILEPKLSMNESSNMLAEPLQGDIRVQPSTSSAVTLEEILARREERLKRLEGQASSLVTKAANTASRGVEMANILDNLHKMYGESGDDEEGSERTDEHSTDDANNTEH